MASFLQTIRNRLQSFRYALAGMVAFLRSEPNGRIHLAATIAVIVAAAIFRCSRGEWALLILAIALVWVTEMLNTVIEKMMDHLSPAVHLQVKWIKDVAAAAVLIAAIAAVTIGALVFVPKLFT